MMDDWRKTGRTLATSLRPTIRAAAAFFWHVSWMSFTLRLEGREPIHSGQFQIPKGVHTISDMFTTLLGLEVLTRLLSPTCMSPQGSCGRAADRWSPGWWSSLPAWWACCCSLLPLAWSWNDVTSVGKWGRTIEGFNTKQKEMGLIPEIHILAKVVETSKNNNNEKERICTFLISKESHDLTITFGCYRVLVSHQKR